MAILSPEFLVTVRRQCAEKMEVTYTKPDINKVAQDINDKFDEIFKQIYDTIEKAAPMMFTEEQKNEVVRVVLFNKLSSNI
jgi:hypothetical protein